VATRDSRQAAAFYRSFVDILETGADAILQEWSKTAPSGTLENQVQVMKEENCNESF